MDLEDVRESMHEEKALCTFRMQSPQRKSLDSRDTKQWRTHSDFMVPGISERVTT